jgi:hypothetical protein
MSPYDVRSLRWRLQHAGEGYVLEGRAEVIGQSRVEIYFPNEWAVREWASFTIPNLLSVLHSQDKMAKDVKQAIEQGVFDADKVAQSVPTAAEIAEKVVESLTKAGLSVQKAKPPSPPPEPVVAVQAAPSPTAYALRRNEDEDLLATGMWVDPSFIWWQLHVKGDGPPLEDKTGALWHWAGGYFHEGGEIWPLLSRNDWTIQDKSWDTVWKELGPLRHTDEIVED